MKTSSVLTLNHYILKGKVIIHPAMYPTMYLDFFILVEVFSREVRDDEMTNVIHKSKVITHKS